MESPEVPIEQTQEDLHHQAEHAHEPWIMGVALTAAVLAVLAAITAPWPSTTQMRRSWRRSRCRSMGVLPGQEHQKQRRRNQDRHPGSVGKARSRKGPQKDRSIRERARRDRDRAEKKKARSEKFLSVHTVLSRGVTLFQIAIAVGAISVLTRRKSLWLAAIAFGAVGTVILIWGLIDSTAIPQPVSETAEAVLISPAEPGRRNTVTQEVRNGYTITQGLEHTRWRNGRFDLANSRFPWIDEHDQTG